MAPVAYAAYPSAPPRPPRPPERPWWRTAGGWGTAAGWLLIAGVGVLLVVGFVRGNAAADRRKTEEAEMAREDAYIRRVTMWMRDTSFTAPPPEGAGRPVPATDRAKRLWVMSRMLVDRRMWEREVMRRHGADRNLSLAAWLTKGYQANAREYPQVTRYVEGRVAAIEEIRETSAAWVEERTAALARESGMSAQAIRELVPPDFGGRALDDAPLAEVMLEFHRHFVRVDPRVHPAGGNQLRFEREEDIDRGNEMVEKLNSAIRASDLARERKLATEKAVVAAAMQ